MQSATSVHLEIYYEGVLVASGEFSRSLAYRQFLQTAENYPSSPPTPTLQALLEAPTGTTFRWTCEDHVVEAEIFRPIPQQ